MKRLFTLASFLLCASFSYSQTLTDIIVPQYMQGMNGTNANRLPYIVRAALTGLTPSATYRYYTSAIATSEAATSNGAGNPFYLNTTGNFSIGSQSLSTAGAYAEFTTDAAGAYTGWFGVEPTGNATRFTPGTIVQLRIVLNDGAGGTLATTRLTTTSTATVINLGTTSADGTGIRSTTATNAVAKNVIFLYDNVAGTGRPITGAFIENDGVAAGSSWATFYKNDVDAGDRTWGTFIPNNLANGIKAIFQYNLSNGVFASGMTSSTASWAANGGGTLSTINATGGITTILVINGALATMPLSLKSFSASLVNGKGSLNWATSNEINVNGFSIEKSTDAKNYAEVGFVKANNAATNQYSFTDATAINGVTYFRLKISDKDGSYKYSQVVTLNNKKSTKLDVYPNPAVNTVTLSHAEATEAAMIKVVSLDGKTISSQTVQTGATQTSVDVSKLVKGSYLVVFESAGARSTAQFVKQ